MSLKSMPTTSDLQILQQKHFRPSQNTLTLLSWYCTHRFTATNQNAKCLIAVDNYIQSPVVGTAVTFAVVQQLLSSSDEIHLAGITSITGGDLLQVDEEIMKVRSVGVGSTNVVSVDRAWLGTLRVTHNAGQVATKIQGNYNIVNNTLNFVEAPYGNNPLLHNYKSTR